MSHFHSTAFSRDRLPDLLELVTFNAKTRWPNVSYFLNSDIAWRLPGSAPKDNIRLWYEEDKIAAFAWFEPNAPGTFDIRCDLNFSHEICIDVLHWCESRCRQLPGMNPWLLNLEDMQDWETALTEGRPGWTSKDQHLQLIALDSDTDRIQFLEEQGYKATQHFAYSLTRSLDISIPDSRLADGMTVRHVLESDFPERVAVHRDAWFKSQFSMEQYVAVRSIEAYRPELDIVVEDKNGTFASYCIGWIDDVLGVGSFEPLGSRPAYRRMGLGHEVTYEGLRRMKKLGMHSAKIGTAGFNERAFNLYSDCGFQLIDKERTYLKKLSSS